MAMNSNFIKSLNYGKVIGNWCANKIQIDSRKVEYADLFVAFKGANHDGHQFIDDAFDKGAVAAITNKFIPNASLWVVEDQAKAIELIASKKRKESTAKFIGITGSVGKTSVKEALAIALASQGKTHSTFGNYNNELGLPIVLSSIEDDAEFCVLEMGMRGLGQIAELTKIAVPNVSIITKIAPVHIEQLGSLENIAIAKSEIFSNNAPNSSAIINKDDEFSDFLISQAKKYGVSNIISFGKSEAADFRLLEAKFTNTEARIKCLCAGELIEFTTKAVGEHHAINLMAVLAAVKAVGGDVKIAAQALKNFGNISGRGDVFEASYKGKQICIVDESYNSSPASLEAAIKTFADANFPGYNRKICIISDMLELGENSALMHANFAKKIPANIDKIITVGSLMENLAKALDPSLLLAHFENKDQLIDSLDQLISNQDVIMIKGSNGTKLHQLAALLRKI